MQGKREKERESSAHWKRRDGVRAAEGGPKNGKWAQSEELL